MPRYDDRHGNTRLYVGHLSSRTRSRDLEHIFSRYGRVRDVDMKHDYAFVEFSDPRDADDARYSLDGRDVDGSRIIVEFARGVPRGSRDYPGRGPPPGSGRCFNCGLDGHWARDCKAGDWKNKCYRCGERGHIERNCKNSPKKLRRSRSPVRRARSRSRSYSRGRSYSRSRSPAKRDRSIERDDRSWSPLPKHSPPPSRERKRTPTPYELDSPRERGSPSPRFEKRASRQDEAMNVASPREKDRSPAGPEREDSLAGRPHSETNGHSRSPSPRDDRSPVDDDYDDRRSPRSSESP